MEQSILPLARRRKTPKYSTFKRKEKKQKRRFITKDEVEEKKDLLGGNLEDENGSS